MAEQTQSDSPVDPETGLYSLQGLARRIDELGALAVRAHASLACVVLAPEVAQDQALPEVTAFCAQAIKSGVRHSDAAGRTGAFEFAVVAPRTGATGAIRLAQPLAVVMRRRSPVSARDLLVRARRAWLDADAESRLGWIRPYEG